MSKLRWSQCVDKIGCEWRNTHSLRSLANINSLRFTSFTGHVWPKVRANEVSEYSYDTKVLFIFQFQLRCLVLSSFLRFWLKCPILSSFSWSWARCLILSSFFVFYVRSHKVSSKSAVSGGILTHFVRSQISGSLTLTHFVLLRLPATFGRKCERTK